MSKPDYRTLCFEEHGEGCELCGSTTSIVAHHIDGDRENNELDNLLPVCRSCHTSIHGGGIEELSGKLPPESRTDKPAGRDGMRPNIQISHSLNGRVKDFAAENDMSTQEAYTYFLEYALEQHEDDT